MVHCRLIMTRGVACAQLTHGVLPPPSFRYGFRHWSVELCQSEGNRMSPDWHGRNLLSALLCLGDSKYTAQEKVALMDFLVQKGSCTFDCISSKGWDRLMVALIHHQAVLLLLTSLKNHSGMHPTDGPFTE